MSDIRQLFNKPKNRPRCADESVPSSNLPKECAEKVPRASLAARGTSSSSLITLVDDEMPDDVIEFETSAETLDESQDHLDAPVYMLEDVAGGTHADRAVDARGLLS